MLDADFAACFQPPFRRAAEQVQFMAALVDQRVAQQSSIISRPGRVRDRVAPGLALLIVDAFRERVGGCRVQQIPLKLPHELLVLAAHDSNANTAMRCRR